jgi:hypothetical protein
MGIREARQALDAGFTRQLEIGKMMYQDAMQKRSERLSAKATKEQRDFLTKERLAGETAARNLQQDRLTQQTQIAERGITAARELQQDRLGHQTSEREASEKTAMDFAFLAEGFKFAHTADERKYQEQVIEAERQFQRETLYIDHGYKQDAAISKAQWEERKLQNEGLVNELKDLRSMQVELFKLYSSSDTNEETLKITSDKISQIGRQIASVRDTLEGKGLLPKSEFTVLDISERTLSDFFEFSPLNKSDIIGLAKDHVESGASAANATKVFAEIMNFLEERKDIEYHDETQESYAERVIRSLAAMSITDEEAPAVSAEESKSTVESVISDAENIAVSEPRPRGADPFEVAISAVQSKANPVIKSDEYINKILSGEVTLFQPRSLDAFLQNQSKVTTDDFASLYARRLMADPEYLITVYSSMLKDIEDRVTVTRPGRTGKSIEVVNPQLKEKADKLNRVISALKDFISAQSQPELGMINPQGGMLSQQNMMAMQPDMTQGDIDYFSPDAINARLQGTA